MLHVLTALALAAAAPQQASPPAPPAALPAELPDAQSSDDIVVSALRIPRDKLPVQVHWDKFGGFQARVDREEAGMFVRCAMNWASPRDLRSVLDGEPNTAPMQAAQGLIVLRGKACQPGFAQRGYPVAANSFLEYGTRRVDRGIIIERALLQYAGDLDLTREATADPAVQARHRERELPRNRRRLDGDWHAWSVTSCLVREQPTLATRLVKAPAGTELERGLIQALMIDGRSCLGQVKRMTIDPANLRGYVMDAYYRWLVAARNVASLVPAAAEPLPPGGSRG